MTGTFAMRAWRMTSFWMCGRPSARGTSSEIAARDHDRVTMVRMPERFAITSWRSSLRRRAAPRPAHGGTRAPSACRRRSARTTPATKSIPCWMRKRSPRGPFCVRQDPRHGQRYVLKRYSLVIADPSARDDTAAPRRGRGRVHRSWIIPSSIQISSPTFSLSQIFRMADRALCSPVPATGVALSVNVLPTSRSTTRAAAGTKVPRRIFGPCRSWRIDTGRPQRDSPSRCGGSRPRAPRACRARSQARDVHACLHQAIEVIDG